MVLPIITTSELNAVIESLEKKKFRHIRYISLYNPKKFRLVLCPSILFNQSIADSKFPAMLKTINVTPIHKSGPKNVPQNYQPISQLNVFSKSFESLMKYYLMQYFE